MKTSVSFFVRDGKGSGPYLVEHPSGVIIDRLADLDEIPKITGYSRIQVWRNTNLFPTIRCDGKNWFLVEATLKVIREARRKGELFGPNFGKGYKGRMR